MSDSRERAALWDNLKFLLILTVVLGHFAAQYLSAQSFRALWIFVYAFHMPAFIYIAGLLHRNRNIAQKAFSFVFLGYLYKIAVFAAKSIFRSDVRFRVLTEGGAPWFMFALAAFIVISYLLRHTDARLVLIASIIVACFAGYDKSIGDFLCLSRIIVFFPFYHAGVMTDRRQLEKLSENLTLKAAGISVVVIWAALCFFLPDDMFAAFHSLVSGRHPFSGDMRPYGYLCRLGCGALSALLVAALIFATPTKRLPVMTHLGQRTLQVYFLHRPLLHIFAALGLPAALCDTAGGRLLYMMSAVALTFILSLRIFSYPFDLITAANHRNPQSD